MRPHFNSRPYGSNNANNVQFNGANASAPQQVMGNQGNFCPNPTQIRPQFPMGMLNNPQLAMLNPNPYFAPGQFFPFPQGSFLNLNTDLAHIFGRNSMNQPQFLPSGVPNLAQNINQLLQMQIPNCGPNNSGPFMSGQSVVNHGNEALQQSVDRNGDFVSPQAQQNQNLNSPGAVKSQSNSGKFNGMNDGKTSWRKSHNSNFVNHKHNASQRGFGKQFHHRQNAQGNKKFDNEYQGKGNRNNGLKNFTSSTSNDNIQVGKKRSLVLNYTEQEIRQWREQRRKNYPSKANIEKKSKDNSTQAETTDEATKMRRQQLKEILSKQAELGCEVAEIPSCYLSDSEQQPHGRQQNNKAFGQRDRFQNKFDKRGKFHQNDWFSKRQRTETNYPPNSQNRKDGFTRTPRSANGGPTNLQRDNKRAATLLRKLLRSDIKRDKKHLLQVFRFMVMNSFFQNVPEKALKFPAVIVKELDEGNELIEEEGQEGKGGVSDPLASTHADNHMIYTGDSGKSCGKEHGKACATLEEEGEIPQAVGDAIE